jgi:type I restriction enzyme S subunit
MLSGGSAMALIEGKLGKYIELRDVRNTELRYGADRVRGVNTTKQMMQTRADLSARDLSKFQIVSPGEFVFNHRTSRNGSQFSIAYNDSGGDIICTEDYVVFRISEYGRHFVLAEWLFMYFNRPEFDRYVITNSWGSSTEFYNWEDLCDVDIEIPPIEVQEKYINAYNSVLANQRSYEQGLEDLKLICDMYIEDIRKHYPCQTIGKYIQRKNERNSNNLCSKVMGLSTKKQFREAQSRVNRNELRTYKLVAPHEIAFVPTTDTWKVLAFSVNNFDQTIVVSPIYEVFKTDSTTLLPEYLAMWLKREEFDRYARFHSWGSARENFSWDEMCAVEIPIPDTKIQQYIVNIYIAYQLRNEINEQLKMQIKDICPVLIKGSLEEAKKQSD